MAGDAGAEEGLAVPWGEHQTGRVLAGRAGHLGARARLWNLVI